MRQLLLASSLLLATLTPAIAGGPDRPPEDEVVYFLLPDRFENGDPANDRGGMTGGPLEHGYNPAHKGFYHGGDLKGLLARLDYLQGMGVTAIWVGPIFRNQPVQGEPGNESSGYHGYWITDFTDVDPHLGTREDLKALVDAAHARGMKFYQDIITNHTADVIAYRECHDPKWKGAKAAEGCPYRSRADYPYSAQGGINGKPINKGFSGDEVITEANFARLTRMDYAYTPYIPQGKEGMKTPAWLNDPAFYHNRGNTAFVGEGSIYGDFVGLDDLFTAHPRVIEGFIEIYGDWIDRYGIDGFRIDTARHVNPEFWRAFLPAMTARAEARGIDNFYMFGEVYDPDPAALATFTRQDRFPTVLDFGFQSAAHDVIAGGAPTSRLRRLFWLDAVYEGGEATARQLPTFLGNHDMGRFSMFVRQGHPTADQQAILERVILGHALMFASRGVPVIYSGDEQGFVSDGNDQAARESLFPSAVDSYNDNDLLGTDATTASANFDTSHPIYQAIARFSALRKAETALRRGRQVVRHADEDGGLFALSRIDDDNGAEILFVMNADDRPRTANIQVSTAAREWRALEGNCAAKASAPGSYRVTVPARGFAFCRSGWPVMMVPAN